LFLLFNSKKTFEEIYDCLPNSCEESELLFSAVRVVLVGIVGDDIFVIFCRLVTLTLVCAYVLLALGISALAALATDAFALVVTLALVQACRLEALTVKAKLTLWADAYTYVIGIVSITLINAVHAIAITVAASATNLTCMLAGRKRSR